MTEGSDAKAIGESVNALLVSRIETLIAYNRALIAVVGVLILMGVVGWQSVGENVRGLNEFKTEQRSINSNQAEWNQHILKALWIIAGDPKRAMEKTQ